MQKMINGVALLSGLVSLSALGGGAYLYVQNGTQHLTHFKNYYILCKDSLRNVS
jgi:hypothetical protein